MLISIRYLSQKSVRSNQIEIEFEEIRISIQMYALYLNLLYRTTHIRAVRGSFFKLLFTQRCKEKVRGNEMKLKIKVNKLP